MKRSALDGLRIHIIDDEEDFARTLASRLELRGMAVKCSFSGEQGLTALAEEIPDVLLLDMRMPGMSGVDVLHAMHGSKAIRNGKSLPVLIISGHAVVRDIHEAEKLGIRGFIPKPLDFEELLNAIASAAGKSKT